MRQGDGERNFHVFYYLFSGLSEASKEKYRLGDLTEYHYLRGGYKNMTREAVIDYGTATASHVVCTVWGKHCASP